MACTLEEPSLSLVNKLTIAIPSILLVSTFLRNRLTQFETLATLSLLFHLIILDPEFGSKMPLLEALRILIQKVFLGPKITKPGLQEFMNQKLQEYCNYYIAEIAKLLERSWAIF